MPLHYAAARRETLPLYTALINAGQDALAVDSKEKNSEVRNISQSCNGRLQVEKEVHRFRIKYFLLETLSLSQKFLIHLLKSPCLVLHGTRGGNPDARPGIIDVYFLVAIICMNDMIVFLLITVIVIYRISHFPGYDSG